MPDAAEHPDSPFVRYKSRHVITWTMVNLTRLHDFPGALHLDRPLAGRTAIVVGAGPSLSRNGHLLAEAQRKGVAIFSVNASDAPCRSYDVTPDVMVVRESLELDDQIEASTARVVVGDIGVHPITWSAMARRESRWFVPMYPRHVQVCRRVGIRPLFGGTSSLCSAVSLAFEWGASKVVLVGADLASTEDGEVYHPSAPRGAARATIHGEEGYMAWTGDEQDIERSERSGQRPQPSEVGFQWVPSADWSGLLPALPTWQNQREWLTTEGARRFREVELVNATEGGGGTLWWRNQALAEVLEAEPDGQAPMVIGEGHRVPHEVSLAVRNDLVLDAHKLKQLASEFTGNGPPDLGMLSHIPGGVDMSRLAESLGEWRILDAPKAMGPERCRYIYQAWVDAADEALAALGVS